ncbi:MAG: hypothetical protein KA715_00225 [Xanthomonadaceae bacterium]|nr:hypothetical protein [Xanthomonadaceae bacterium]
MKFIEAWKSVSRENLLLKIFTITLSIVSLGAVAVAITESSKEPLVIERGCKDGAIRLADKDRTDQEVKTFIKEAVSARFNSDAVVISEMLAVEENQSRQNEQKELSARSMSQTVLVRKIDIQGGEVKTETDRIISVGDVRSAFIFPITIQIAKIQRTETNPYGLQAIKFVQVVAAKDKSGATK